MDGCPAAISIPLRRAANFRSAALRINLKLHACLFPAKAPLSRNSYVRKKFVLQSNRLRLLPRVPRQTRGVPINAQLLRASRAQLVLRQHAKNRFTDHPVGLGL